MDYDQRKEVERRLYNLPDLCSEIRMKLRDHLDTVPIPAMSFDRPYISPTNEIISSTERLAFQYREQDMELLEKIDEFKQMKIAIECLSRRQREVVRMRYWERMTNLEIGFELSPQISPRWVREVRNRAIKRISEKLQRCRDTSDMDY